MKNSYGFCISFLFMLAFLSCRKSDNPKLPAVERVPVPLVQVDAGKPVFIQDAAAFSSSFTVDLYFKSDVKPKKMDIVATRNGDANNIKVFKADVTSFPATFTVTGADLAQLFGIAVSDIQPGDVYEFRVDETLQNGTVIPGFSSVANAYGANITVLPGASIAAKFTAICPVNLDNFAGTAMIADPDFWGATYPVTVTVEPGDILKIDGWVQTPGAIVRIKVNKDAQTVAIDKQVYYPTLPTTSYHNPTVEGTGTIDACNNTITMTLDNAVDEGDFGTATVVLSK